MGCSAVALNLDPVAISQVAATSVGLPEEATATIRRFSRFSLRKLTPSQARPLHALLRHLDETACIDSDLPAHLGLDDVITHLVATWLEPRLLAEQRSDQERLREREGRSGFDALIDDIRANLDPPLRRSDLEARSHYSRRTLQHAFHAKLDTTPMQWIREQRLTMAMEPLRSDPALPAIRAVAQAYGCRQTSHFSADCKRRFGISPLGGAAAGIALNAHSVP